MQPKEEAEVWLGIKEKAWVQYSRENKSKYKKVLNIDEK